METLKSGEYYGITKKAINIGGISLYEQQYAPLSSSPLHYHQREHFCFALKGAFHEIDQKDDLLIDEGQLLIYPKNREHKTVIRENARSGLFVEFDTLWLEKLKDAKITFGNFSVINNQHISHLFFRIANEFRKPGNASNLLLEGLILESVVELSRRDLGEKKLVPYQVKKIRSLLQESYAEKWTLDNLATQLNFHPVYLNKLFKQYFGKTIHLYLEDLRIERVCDKLKTTNEPITNIAFECGFNDASHLCKVFAKRKGVRLMEYKMMA
ncbi:MAG: AraC family transcriptional regulator [Mucilaginibacter sp.]|nr:AraC family transcriptional regulator [Mucilaginibacter sp.]